MNLGKPSPRPPHLTPRVYLIAISSVTAAAVAIYLLATWIFGFPSASSARVVAFLYVFYLAAVTFPFALAWLPRSARSWLSRVVQVAPSWERYERLRLDAKVSASSRPDSSSLAVRVRRRDKVPAWLAMILAIAIPLALLTIPGATLVVGILVGSGAVAMLTRSSRKWSKLARYRLELVDNELLQKDPSGVIVARIDLTAPFTYEYLDKATGSAIYQLRQCDQRLEFTSEDPLAKHVVPGFLHLEWPPIDRLSF